MRYCPLDASSMFCFTIVVSLECGLSSPVSIDTDTQGKPGLFSPSFVQQSRSGALSPPLLSLLPSEQQLWEKQMATDWGSFVARTLNTLWKRTLSCSVGQRNQGRRFMARKRKPLPSCGSFSLVFSFAQGSEHGGVGFILSHPPFCE